jgi:glycine/D-amino acid oxidase-like deaminating enzyme
MLDPAETDQDDLRQGRGPWQSVAPSFSQSDAAGERCDVLVVGAGITGSLVAEHLTACGYRPIVLERERPGFGSTAASTALLQWEIDKPLRTLAERYGFDRAASIYRRSFMAAQGLVQLIKARGLAEIARSRETVYLATEQNGPPELAKELAVRHRADLPGELLGDSELKERFRLHRAAAIVSRGSADVDPLILAHSMLDQALHRGARLIEGEATDYWPTRRGMIVELADGREIEADHVILATGYAMPTVAANALHSVASSWVIATPPQPPSRLWPGSALIWEASDDYLYARTTRQGRIVLGGEDEDIEDAEGRERLLPQKTKVLELRLFKLWPHAPARAQTSWAGAFGKTVDGLPLIGPVPGLPHLFAAFGYGGNGITFSYLASRLVTAMLAGQRRSWFAHFALDRTP